jgi:GNAT superfamily N-acetyltransferase
VLSIVDALAVDGVLKVRSYDGWLLLAFHNDALAGCAALRPLEPFRSLGLGRMLAEHIVGEARKAGYRCMRLDSLPSMAAALALYRQLGFREIPPYRTNPIEGAVFLELQWNEPTNDT